MTVGGVGSGAASAIYLSLSERAAPLLSGVLAISGSPLAPWAHSEHARENARRFIDRVGCYGPDSQSVVTCLRAQTTEALVVAVEEVNRLNRVAQTSHGDNCYVFHKVLKRHAAPWRDEPLLCVRSCGGHLPASRLAIAGGPAGRAAGRPGGGPQSALHAWGGHRGRGRAGLCRFVLCSTTDLHWRWPGWGRGWLGWTAGSSAT